MLYVSAGGAREIDPKKTLPEGTKLFPSVLGIVATPTAGQLVVVTGLGKALAVNTNGSGHESCVKTVFCYPLGPVAGLSVSKTAGGRKLGATGGEDRVIHLWDLTTHACVGRVVHSAPITAIAMNSRCTALTVGTLGGALSTFRIIPNTAIDARGRGTYSFLARSTLLP